MVAGRLTPRLQPFALASEFCPASKTTVISVPGGEGRDHLRELGDVGLVPRVGVRQQRDAAVAGDHQPQADQPQVGVARGMGRSALPACNQGSWPGNQAVGSGVIGTC